MAVILKQCNLFYNIFQIFLLPRLILATDCDYSEFRTIRCTGVTSKFLQENHFEPQPYMYREFICNKCNLSTIPSHIFYKTNEKNDQLQFITINFNYCNVTGFKRKSFRGLSLLKKLYLTGNSILNVNGVFHSLKYLEYLYLDYNNIEILQRNTFLGLIHLIYLDLRNNQISIVEENAFTDLENLEKLYLDDNKIKTLDGDALSKFVRIDTMSLSFNLLESINVNIFTDYYYLKVLWLDNNNFKQIPNELLKNAKYLLQLDISSNPLETISSKTLTSDYLGILDAKNSSLSTINNLFINLPNLQELDVSNNNLTNINLNDFSQFQRIKSLNFSHNSIRHIDCTRNSIPTLLKIDISYNELPDFDYVCLENKLPNLETLKFSNNSLSDHFFVLL